MRKFWIRRFRFHCLISWTWYTYFYFGLSKSTIFSKFSYCVTCNPVEFHKCCECWTLVPNHPHFHHQHAQFVTTFLGGCVTYTSSISSPQISSDHKLVHQGFFFCPTVLTWFFIYLPTSLWAHGAWKQDNLPQKSMTGHNLDQLLTGCWPHWSYKNDFNNSVNHIFHKN